MSWAVAMELLEWACFGSSMLCVFLYGQSRLAGASVGMLTAALFIAWGLLADVPAAALTNVAFFALHTRNWLRAEREGERLCLRLRRSAKSI